MSVASVLNRSTPEGAKGGSDRRSAVWIGVLWILATVLPVSSIVPWTTLEEGDGLLANAATHTGQLTAWTLLNVGEALTTAGVAFLLYPIVRRATRTSVERGLALWYVGTRITESASYLMSVLAIRAFLPLSREFGAAGSPGGSHFQTSEAVLRSTSDLALMLAETFFAVGGVMLYYLLFRSGLVPRWLSLWGLVSAPLFVIASLSFLWTDDPNTTLANLLHGPLAVQELVLALWLIVKGFTADRIDT